MSANQNLDAGGGDGGSDSDSTNTDRTTQTQRRALDAMPDPVPTRSARSVERRAIEQMQDPAPEPSTQQNGGSASPPAGFDPGEIPSPDGSAPEPEDDLTTSSTRTDIGVGGVDTSPPDVIDRAIEGAQEGGEQLVEDRINRAQNTASGLMDDRLNAALLVGTTAAPGVPPANFALGARALGAAGGAAAGALGLGALSQSDIENPGLPDIGAGGTETTTRSTVSTGEIPAPENPLSSVPSEIPAPTSPTGATQSEISTPSNGEIAAPGIAIPETPPSQTTGEISTPSDTAPGRGGEIDVPAGVASDGLRAGGAVVGGSTIVDDPTGPTIDDPTGPTIEQPTEPSIDDDPGASIRRREHEPFRFPADGEPTQDDVSRSNDPAEQAVERAEIAQAPTAPDPGRPGQDIGGLLGLGGASPAPDAPPDVDAGPEIDPGSGSIGDTGIMTDTPPITPPGTDTGNPPAIENELNTPTETTETYPDTERVEYEYGYETPTDELVPGNDLITTTPTLTTRDSSRFPNRTPGGLPGFGGGGGGAASPAPVFGGGSAVFDSTIATPREVLGTDDDEKEEQLTLFGGV